MNCPNCGSSMSFDHRGVNNAPNGVTYDQEVYHCPHDDWWVTVESPKEA